jgi:hypothetical protein
MCLPERTSKVVLSAHQRSNAGVMPRTGTTMEKSNPTEACLRLESVARVMAIPNASKAETPSAKIKGVLKTDSWAGIFAALTASAFVNVLKKRVTWNAE